MKSIYKREPIQRTLPKNYDDIDAMAYNNINAFKGLQVFDNPLLADINSTYDCKNVYVDEHSNLTLRPALRPTLENVIPNETYSYTSSDATTKIKLVDNILQIYYNGVKTGEYSQISNITIAEHESVYIFANTDSALVLYKVVDGILESVDGEVLLDDPLKTDISHYNILNDKVKVEYAKAITETVRPEDLYIPNYQIPLSVDWTQPYNITIGINRYIICSRNKISVISKTGIAEYSVLTGYQQRAADWCVSDDGETIKVTVSCHAYPKLVEDIPEGVIPEIAGQESIKYFEIRNNAIEKQYTATVTYETPLYAFPCNGYVLLLKTFGLPDDDWPVYIHKFDSNFDTGAPGDSDDLEGWSEVTVDGTLLSVPFVKDKSIITWFYGLQDSILFVIDGRKYSSQDLRFASYNYSGSRTDADTVSTSISADSPSLPNMNIISAGNMLYLGNKRGNKRVTVASSITITDCNNTLPVIALAATKLYLQSDIPKVFNLSTDRVIEYPTSEPAILANDDFVLYTDSALWRTAGLATKLVDRITDSIPVLSNISEKVVTSFFLDNCWWFVTEHSVFGTGVDANGIATIEYFDPLKYFKFSETITAAIRMSDSSFWLFHNNGAYLIYKSTVTLLEGTEYRWLCTATAKSKGCDFENAVSVLPVTNEVVTVTGEDICIIQMKENIQSDERSLQPLTLALSAVVRQLLDETASIKIFNYQYLTIFVANRLVKDGTTPALVYDNQRGYWWLWEFPVDEIINVYQDGSQIISARVDEKITCLELTNDEYNYQLGSLQYEVYADRLFDQRPIQISWGWQSAVQIFGSVDRRKQLLFTTFVFDDFMPNDIDGQVIEFGYYFDIYSRNYATSKPDTTTATVYRVSNKSNKTTIAAFNYLQLVLINTEFDDDRFNFEVLTKPKICSISFKYRTLRGELG